MKSKFILLSIPGVLFGGVLFGGVLIGGCASDPDYSKGPEAWQKTPDTEKLERIKHMPLSPDQKVSGIEKLNISQADKDKAIAEVRSGGNSGGPGAGQTPTGPTGAGTPNPTGAPH